jgi:hypothetical protein
MTTFTTEDRIEAEQDKPQSFWNNRLVRITTHYEGDTEVIYQICEVYYNREGQPVAYCDACLLGDTPEEAKEVHARLAEAFDHPVLDSEKDFTHSFEFHGEEAK